MAILQNAKPKPEDGTIPDFCFVPACIIQK